MKAFFVAALLLGSVVSQAAELLKINVLKNSSMIAACSIRTLLDGSATAVVEQSERLSCESDNLLQILTIWNVQDRMHSELQAKAHLTDSSPLACVRTESHQEVGCGFSIARKAYYVNNDYICTSKSTTEEARKEAVCQAMTMCYDVLLNSMAKLDTEATVSLQRGDTNIWDQTPAKDILQKVTDAAAAQGCQK